ncbi:hypothetical protein [Flavobacterium sp. 102]|uniref:hypothetical protein n=1 Tax=Flavobacterium sp. 102 TaxID=2135623 RepID=UPI000F1957BF|nr:hypothetical protein [Flavobacterium sp. 102]RKS02793.1 hypothetical protein C8C84_2522 [Flavobacterium sp. 102]
MKNYLSSAALCFIVMSCTPFKPAISHADINTLTEYKVKGRQGILINQKLTFGEYTTSKVKRSWTKGGNTRVPVSVSPVVDFLYPEILTADNSNRYQTFAFQMNDGLKNYTDVYAATDFASERLLVGNNPNSIVNIIKDVTGKGIDQSYMFYAQIFVNQDNKPWELVLDNNASQRDAKQYVGYFGYDQNRYYTLKPITELQTNKGPKPIWMGSVGYEICNPNNQAVAAVSLMDNGLVYLAPTNPEERFLLANLCATLLLQQDIAE